MGSEMCIRDRPWHRRVSPVSSWFVPHQPLTLRALANPSRRLIRRVHRRLRSLRSLRSTTNGPLNFYNWRRSRCIPFTLHPSLFKLHPRFPAVCGRLASCHRRVSMARTSYPLCAALFCILGRCAVAPREDWKVQSVPTGRGQSIASFVSFAPVG